MRRILVLCTGNSSRSQMAEGLLREIGAGRVDVRSAGTRPSTVRAEAVTVMGELGIDISSHRSKHVDEFAHQAFDVVLTVCDDAREACPVFPGGTVHVHQSFEDPAAVEGPEEARLAAFRRVRDELRAYLTMFVSGS